MLQFIQQITRKSGELILSADKSKLGTTEKTNARNIVTAYDKAVQDLIFEAFAEEVPGITMIGEETGLGKVPEKGEFIIVDPIDGTSNFTKGVKKSAVSIAYGVDGVLTHGCVYDPYLDEMFYASLGGGAYLNGEKLVRDNSLDLANSIVCYDTCPYDVHLSKDVFALGERVFRSSLDLRRLGVACLEICYVAANRFDVYLDMILYPWDYAAADLILREAGGSSIAFNGEPLSLQERSSLIVGSTKAVIDCLNIVRDMGLSK